MFFARFLTGPDIGHYLSRYANQQALNYSAPSGLQTSPCYCRIFDGVCACTSQFQNRSYDHDLWSQMEAIRSPQLPALSDVVETIAVATGYDIIEPRRSEGGGLLETGGRTDYHDGELEELFLSYDKPHLTVRALYARHDTPAEDLFIITPGSWTSSENVMGLGRHDYHREIGKRLFNKGIDVIAFDHASNGQIEALMNVVALIEGGQITGIWSRSVCDLMDRLKLRAKYRRIVLYGLSRGGRTAEMISTLCSGISLAIVDDNFSDDEYTAYHWNSMNST